MAGGSESNDAPRRAAGARRNTPLYRGIGDGASALVNYIIAA